MPNLTIFKVIEANAVFDHIINTTAKLPASAYFQVKNLLEEFKPKISSFNESSQAILKSLLNEEENLLLPEDPRAEEFKTKINELHKEEVLINFKPLSPSIFGDSAMNPIPCKKDGKDVSVHPLELVLDFIQLA